jgi:ethanolamine utilization protein EutA
VHGLTHHHEATYDSAPSSERIRLKTVGVDVGSSTSHVMFAEVHLERDGRGLSSRFRVVDRVVTFRGEVILTPYADPDTIDVPALAAHLDAQYAAARETRDSVDAGAVVVTGRAAHKQNAPALLSMFADSAGRFVCAAAGPNLEATLAAHGSGATGWTECTRVLVVDIGGGTTKFAVVEHGVVRHTAAIDLGARLVAWDADDVVIRVEPTVAPYVEALPRVGDHFIPELQAATAERMGARLVAVLRGLLSDEPLDEVSRALYLTEPLPRIGPVDAVTFSGGVSEFVDGRESRPRGDVGALLGAYLREHAGGLGAPVRPATAGIRATIIGASQHTVQVTGNTILVSAADALPLRNLPVAEATFGSGARLDQQLAAAVGRLDIVEGREPCAVSVRWQGPVDIPALQSFAAQLRTALPATFAQAEIPLVLVVDVDVAGLVGMLLTERDPPGCAVIVLDQVEVRDLDYVDIGPLDREHNVVPVVVKSLVFR